MREVVQKFVSTPLFSFQDLKLSTRNIILVLKDILNTTSGLLPIPDPHAIGVPSNTLKRHLIGSRVANGIRDLVISFSTVKLTSSRPSNFTFTYKKGTNNTSLVDLLFSKGALDNHSFHKVSRSFLKVVPSKRNSIAIRVAIVHNIESIIQVKGYSPKWYFLIHVPNQ